MIRRGLRILNNFKILKSIETNISIRDVSTIKKSNLDQLSLIYAFSPITKPWAIILTTHSKIKMELKT